MIINLRPNIMQINLPAWEALLSRLAGFLSNKDWWLMLWKVWVHINFITAPPLASQDRDQLLYIILRCTYVCFTFYFPIKTKDLHLHHFWVLFGWWHYKTCKFEYWMDITTHFNKGGWAVSGCVSMTIYHTNILNLTVNRQIHPLWITHFISSFVPDFL